MTPCSLVEVYRRFGANHCLIFREEATQRTRELYRTDYTMSLPLRRYILHTHCLDKLKKRCISVNCDSLTRFAAVYVPVRGYTEHIYIGQWKGRNTLRSWQFAISCCSSIVVTSHIHFSITKGFLKMYVRERVHTTAAALCLKIVLIRGGDEPHLNLNHLPTGVE